MLLPRKYYLRDGCIYWHKLYFDLVPKWMTHYAPPLGAFNYAAYLYQPWKYIMELYRHAKWFLQRGKRGYADCDTWSMDWYLAHWLPQAIREMRDHAHGSPMHVSPKRWAKILSDIAYGFEAAQRLQDHSQDIKWDTKVFNQGMRLFHKYFFNLWD